MQWLNFLDDYDFGNYVQALSSVWYGKPLWIMSQPWYQNGFPQHPEPSSFLSSHFSPFLFLLVPFAHSPPALLVIEDVSVALAAIPIYLLSMKVLQSQRLSFALVSRIC
jgi:Predicted membrane protein